MNFLQRCTGQATLIALCLAAASGAYAQVSSINSVVINQRVFNDIPSSTDLYYNNYPSEILLTELGVSAPTGYANRDVWYFANTGGAYQFQNNDYFDASFNVTLSGGSGTYYPEAGFLFSNPSGSFGGDSQSLVKTDGEVVQFGGISYFGFSPANGGTSVPNYAQGETYTLGLDYVIDPNTGMNAFRYSVNGVFATSSPGDTYFDFAPGQGIGNVSGNELGGYFQIPNNPSNPGNSGQAVFTSISIVSVPEPSTLAFLGLGLGSVALVLRRRRI